MNIETEVIRNIVVVGAILSFPIREFFIRKRIIKIYSQLRKTVPIETRKIDLTGLQPVIKYSSTEKILSKIENHLNKVK